MIKNKLDKEEKAILDSFNKGEWKSIKSKKTINRLRNAARNTIEKNLRIHVNISRRDLEELQKKAIKEGLPYQAFISSILHKYVNGRLSER
ncbi:MAG: antitoxin [Ignavibacteria bacterium RIFOXYB2_FULL_35_12]|nr:MAG: antitoxin [Ignavibacteria bacterium GWA2_36_19]OGU52890.1 MAG: antitoxin [Ignavibacteria bacterium GWC2_35_8]OGU57838.1 MAG: antitoxin [Ignavibacteria bacterium GWF2_35_20]OGU81878.1 MAG: antitoxin [Ignavibacteria bacterium RIFOXYA2_FULL_35_9]OGU88061.1 MAG: antitoxin [Ignavibacteria bacterium RIFOXYA12_FULL_35_25]OGU93088.1 MAG: antitoxin [Ignavibacteria bacterium RIFOXYB12_FULL_35_14]OGU98247.1 MAG: antitoxin [Ignavibacteria bacterium RIFOXYC2_FULL_35_16]OGV03397.1 MAG: antitoxin [